MANSNGRQRQGPRGAEPKGSALYEVLKGIDFERRAAGGQEHAGAASSTS